MKKRLGDRRSRPRFDVVGSLTGQVEVWQPAEVHNLGSGGALVESTLPLSPGVRISGRLSAGREHCRVRADVVHARAAAQLYGLQWVDSSSPIEDLIGTLQPLETEVDLRTTVETDRRRSRRYAASDDLSLDLSLTFVASVLDISGSGLLLSARSPLEPASTALITMRLGDNDFTGRIEVRRILPSENGDWRIGAQFSSLDDASRRNLDALLAPKH